MVVSGSHLAIDPGRLSLIVIYSRFGTHLNEVDHWISCVFDLDGENLKKLLIKLLEQRFEPPFLSLYAVQFGSVGEGGGGHVGSSEI